MTMQVLEGLRFHLRCQNQLQGALLLMVPQRRTRRGNLEGLLAQGPLLRQRRCLCPHMCAHLHLWPLWRCQPRSPQHLFRLRSQPWSQVCQWQWPPRRRPRRRRCRCLPTFHRQRRLRAWIGINLSSPLPGLHPPSCQGSVPPLPRRRRVQRTCTWTGRPLLRWRQCRRMCCHLLSRRQRLCRRRWRLVPVAGKTWRRCQYPRPRCQQFRCRPWSRHRPRMCLPQGPQTSRRRSWLKTQ
mmetsp:Transcript_13220/g.27653  ORF Transcript_13220/g.27653 Transcript_13220/m.27653 type:complete len:239 (+) Transcript_13220:875-1591(+)